MTYTRVKYCKLQIAMLLYCNQDNAWHVAQNEQLKGTADNVERTSLSVPSTSWRCLSNAERWIGSVAYGNHL